MWGPTEAVLQHVGEVGGPYKPCSVGGPPDGGPSSAEEEGPPGEAPGAPQAILKRQQRLRSAVCNCLLETVEELLQGPPEQQQQQQQQQCLYLGLAAEAVSLHLINALSPLVSSTQLPITRGFRV